MNVGLVWELREEQCFVVEFVCELYERVDRGFVRVVWELREVLWERLCENMRVVERGGQIFSASRET